MAITLKQQIEEVLKQNKKAMHVDEIAQALIDKNLVTDRDKGKLANSISAALSSDIKKHKAKSSFRKIKNKQGGSKRGFYQVKIQRKEDKVIVIESISKAKKTEASTISKSYIGTAGEHLVFSELLFQGFNASSMAVDEGIDIVCFKGSDFFYIQVKTANLTDNGTKKKFLATIKNSQFERYARHKPFYIIVLRHFDGRRFHHNFVVLPSMDIERFIEQGMIKNSTDLSLTLEVSSDLKLMLNGNVDISYYFNKFELIK